MIYHGHKINAQVPTWDNYEVNDDGELGDYVASGGGDIDWPEYVVWSINDDGEEDECLGEFDNIEEAKEFIDKKGESPQA